MKYENKALIAYTFGHFCMDGLCAIYLWRFFYGDPKWAFLGFAAYHLLAFMLQPFFGLLADEISNINWTAVSGLLAVVSVVLAGLLPVAGLITLGAANALFHVEGGFVSLHREKRTIGPGGIFVAGGAFGVSLGSLFGKCIIAAPLIFAAMSLLAIVCLLIGYFLAPDKSYRTRTGAFNIKADMPLALLLALTFLSVLVRGYAGGLVAVAGSLGGVWKPVIISVFVFAGKFTGGMLADKFGARTVGAAALLAATLCFFIPGTIPALIGLYLLNVPMSITLALLSDCMPENTGFAFGLAPLALIIATLLLRGKAPTGMTATIVLPSALVVSAFFMLVTIKRGQNK